MRSHRFRLILLLIPCVFFTIECEGKNEKTTPPKTESLELIPEDAEGKLIEQPSDDSVMTESVSTDMEFNKFKNAYNDAINNRKSDYEVSVGNIMLIMPRNYVGGYYDEAQDKYITIDDMNSDYITGGGYYKIMNIIFFRKDSDARFELDYGYNVDNVPVLADYLNGTSERKPRFFVKTMRRTKLKTMDVAETLTLGRFSADDIIFERQFVFMDDEYFYKVGATIWGIEFEIEVRKEMSEYFNEEGNWIKDSEIYDKFDNFQEMPEYINNLFLETDKIFDSITFQKNTVFGSCRHLRSLAEGG